MRFILEQIRVGGDRNFGYLLGDREAGEGLLIDPSFDPDAMVARAEAQKLRITHILNTHGHPDHTNGNAMAKTLTGAPILGGPGHPGPVDQVVQDGARIPFGGYHLLAWQVPGHCPDHLAFLVEEMAAGLTGDLLFVGKVGGTSSDKDARVEWGSLQRLQKGWPRHTTIWPGHDYGVRPSSTLAWEAESNPFLRCPTLEAFIHLKNHWAQFKGEHGLK